ncbi:MAG: hypothetical protein ACRDA5_13755, partial [Clostridium sp.]
MKNKESGSVLLAVLIISMTLSIIGAVTTSAILSTTRGNAMGRNKEDLFYSAESGIELGIALVRNDVRYLESKHNVFIKKQIDEKSDRLIADGINSVHSVDISMESVVNSKAKIKSIAYGYDENGRRDLNNKRSIEKTFSRLSGGGNGPLAKGLLENSIVAEERININALGTINMGTTQVTSGLELATIIGSPDTSILPTKKKDMFQSSIFKDSIINQRIIEVNSVVSETIGISLDSEANVLSEDGTSVASNGIGKLVITNASIGHTINDYNVYLVNADKLIIDASILGSALNENKAIVICSGDIEIKLGTATGSFAKTTFFGKNVSINTPGGLSIDSSPSINRTTDHLNEQQLNVLNEVISKYVENWGVLSDSIVND